MYIDAQNWKITKTLLSQLSATKNVAMFTYRVTNNRSQVQAAKEAGISSVMWMDLENKKAIPTMAQAEKVAMLLGKTTFSLFPLIRHESIHIRGNKQMSKLTLIRGIRGIAQVDLASKTGVSLKVIQKVERVWKDFQEVPDEHLDAVQMLADFLKEDVINIIGQAI